MILEAIKWDQSIVWHIFSNDECLLQSERPELLWTHSQEEVKNKCFMFQRKNMPYQIVPWEVRSVKVFFWHTLDQNTSYACSIEGATWESMSKLRRAKYSDHGTRLLISWNMMGIYYLAVLRFNMVVVIEYAYKRLMSPMDALLKMSLFFALMQMNALEDMV